MSVETLKTEAEAALHVAYQKYLAWQKASGEALGIDSEADIDSFTDWVSYDFMTEKV